MDLDHTTGGIVEGWAEVQQSIATILSTRFATRVFRREFGSGLPDLVDGPMNDAGILALYMAVIDAVSAWEPRFEITNVSVSGLKAGAISLVLTGNYRPDAHLGDLSSAADDTRTVRVIRDRAEQWSIVT